jgi:hypothetical protein
LTTKHDILIDIYKTYDIEDIVKKNLQQSIADESYKDLSQHIYLVLYDLPFSTLYMLHSRKRIPHYITGIIRNQRQSPYLEYQKHFKHHSKDYEFVDDNDVEDFDYIEPIDETEEKLRIVNKVLHKDYPISDISNFTYEQKENLFCVEIFKLYQKKKIHGYSFTKLAKDLNINRTLISDSIQQAKAIIIQEYEKTK